MFELSSSEETLVDLGCIAESVWEPFWSRSQFVKWLISPSPNWGRVRSVIELGVVDFEISVFPYRNLYFRLRKAFVERILLLDVDDLALKRSIVAGNTEPRSENKICACFEGENRLDNDRCYRAHAEKLDGLPYLARQQSVF